MVTAERRLQIPERFLQRSTLRTCELILRAFLIWSCPAAVAYAVLSSGLPAGWLLALPLWLMAGQGLQLLGIIGHDGSHANLHRDRWTSFLIGILCSSAVPFHTDVGFAVSHAEHHRWVNTRRDPDALVLSRYSSVLARIFLVRSIVTRRYLKTTLLLALNAWPDDRSIRLSLPRAQLVTLARINLVASACWLALYVAVALRSPLMALCFIFGPYLGAALLSGLRPYVEHAGTGEGKYTSARSYIHPVFTFFFGGANYHLAHHLFPTVPCYRLPAFHRWLDDQGRLPSGELHIDRSLLGYPLYASGARYPYPCPPAPAEGEPGS